MKALLNVELSRFYSKIWFYAAVLCTLAFGVVVGMGFSLSLGPAIFKNAPYTIAFMGGFLSLFVIFFATVLTTQIAFKETDHRFHLIFYALPIRPADFVLSRFLAIFSLSLLGLVLLMIGFAVGQQLPSDRSRYTDFHWVYYGQPLWVFGLINTLFCVVFLHTVAWVSRSKMMVYVSGILLYIFYMVMLIFSGSPLMAKGMPPSATSVLSSAIFDPFGLSGFFMQTTQWTVEERNTRLIFPEGIFLYNRLGVLGISVAALLLLIRQFRFEKATETQRWRITNSRFLGAGLQILPSLGNLGIKTSGLWSMTKIDLKYVVKSIPFGLMCLGFLFAVGMEMYGDIEKGIRLPQKYATSGLLASTIIDEFNLLCLLAMIFYANDIFWRSRANHFHLIEAATPVQKSSIFFSKWLTMGILTLIFSGLVIVLGLVMQWLYDFPHFDGKPYAGVFVFVSWRVMLASGVLLLVQQLVPHKIVGLVASAVVIGFIATPFGNRILNHPTLEFLMPFAGNYTDINGFGSYLGYFVLRYAFGSMLVVFLMMLVLKIKTMRALVVMGLVLVGIIWTGMTISSGYRPRDREAQTAAQVLYEKQYRAFQNLPQPTVTDIKTRVDLFPENQSYTVEGQYVLENKTRSVVDSVLVNFADDFEIVEAQWEGIPIRQQYSVVRLPKRLLPNARAKMTFKMRYAWSTVNGHQPFNAIVQNGTFLRISHFYPQIGYLAANEIESEDERKKQQLKPRTALAKLETTKDSTDDFVGLDMTISTPASQTAIGMGELKEEWIKGQRRFFRYQTPSPIPFRFGLSSAKYATKKENYKGKNIEIYYHPTHHHNVNHLLQNIKLTLDYCQANFGPYPFQTIRFAEVSGFTRGFAATAYPATVFMPENMVFDANIHGDNKQDVINELAGHELSHLWWGNSQISPDEREGAEMLTESLAMYTELMLSQKMHGTERMRDNVKLYQRMYREERGFTNEQPLYKLHSENVHLSYYKGLVVMYQLSMLIGEAKVNKALRHFLQKHAYPHPKPISTDLLAAFYAEADTSVHRKIDELFKQMVTYDFSIKRAEIKPDTPNSVVLELEGDAQKIVKNETQQVRKLPLNDSLEVGIYFDNAPPVFQKTKVIDGKIRGNFPLKQRPKRVVLDPALLFLHENAELSREISSSI